MNLIPAMHYVILVKLPHFGKLLESFFDLFILLFAGLIKLPGELQPSPYYRPAQLPTDCGEQLENVTVVAVGMGKTSLNQMEAKTILHEGVFTTLPADECLELITVLGTPDDSDAVLCTKPDGETAVYDGDSGNFGYYHILCGYFDEQFLV